MYKIKVELYFSAAHNLREYKGKCEELHGHNWKVEASLKAAKPGKSGMVLDFSYFKEKLHEILDDLDHKYLNSLPYFKKINPTSENLARYIFDRLKPGVPGLASVTVWESHNSNATYFKE